MNFNKILGYRHNDVEKNYQELKSHPFFEGVDFNQTEPSQVQVNEEFKQAFNNVYVEQQQRFMADYQSVADIQQISQEIEGVFDKFSFGDLPKYEETKMKSESPNTNAQEQP